MTVYQARKLRKNASLPERLLWNELKTASPRIRRQHPIGDFVLDFYCPAARIAIEIDGVSHDMGDQPSRDARRDAWIEAQGLTIVRIAASEVLNDPPNVADAIMRMCRTPPPRR